MVESKSLANPMGAATERRASVYLPPSDETSPQRAYPTPCLLHGMMDSRGRLDTELLPFFSAVLDGDLESTGGLNATLLRR